MSPLQEAFHKYRNDNNLAKLAEELLSSKLYIIVTNKPNPTPLLSRGPKREEWCITASESENLISRTGQKVSLVSGRNIISLIETASGLLIVSEEGGDYISAKELGILRSATLN